MRRHPLYLAALLAVSTGCTPTGTWGNEARYAPDFRGYVIDRSPTSSARLLLRNPITAKKIRCREDLAPYLVPVTREQATVVRDGNVALAFTMPITMTLLFPVVGSGVAMDLGSMELRAPSEGLYLLVRSPGRDTLYEQGKRAFDEKRFAAAERLFERALAKPVDGWSSFEPQRSTYFLGILYEQDGRPRDAARAYRQFIERAEVRDEKAYEDAEKRLAAIEPAPFATCQSQAPLAFTWPAPRR